jgi:hypothetical protein
MLRVQIADTPFCSETGGIRGFQSRDPSVNRTAVTPDGDEHTDVPLKPKPERPNHDDFVTVLTTLRYIAIWEKEQDLFESANRALEKVGKAPMENREGLVMNGEKSPG